MSTERAVDMTEVVPPAQDGPWHEYGEPLDPGAPTQPPTYPPDPSYGPDPGPGAPANGARHYGGPPYGPPEYGTPPGNDPYPGTPQPGAPQSEAPQWDAPQSDQPRGRWRFVPRSLASRLVAFVVTLVLLVVAASGAATYVALRSFLNSRLDQQLTTTASLPSIRDMLQGQSSQSGTGLHNPLTVWIAIVDPSGNLVRTQTAPGTAELQVSAAERRTLAAGTSHPVSLTTTDGVHLRVVSDTGLQLHSPFGFTSEDVSVLVGLSTSEVNRTLHRVIWLEVAIGALAVAVALALTTWGVSLSLRPLTRVTRTAREVSTELASEGAGLDLRVPAGDPETEVGQLAESFNSLMGTVETQFAARVESEERMRQFLADASHELRTPLTSIRGYAELARMRRANGDAEQADTMARIESEGTRMSRLVEDLLLLARGDAGSPPQVEVVDVAELIDEAVDGARAAFPSRRIDIASPGPDLTLMADHDQLLRVLRNLITNAASYTDPSGPIRVSGESAGDHVLLRVIDAGPGLPPDQAQHVFERFWRADKARSRARGGSGLGLAIVAQLVAAHGGSVEFDSSVEHGSTVTVWLPRYATEPQQYPAPEAQPYPPAAQQYASEPYPADAQPYPAGEQGYAPPGQQH